MKFNYQVPGHFQFSGRDGSGTWKKVRDGSCTGIPSGPAHNTFVLGKDYEWNDFSTLPQETCVPLLPLTAAQQCTLLYVWRMDWNRRAKFWNGSTARGGRVCPLECPLAGHTRSCHSWSETNPGHSNKNTLVVQTPPTNIPSALLTNVSKWTKFQIKQNLLIIFRGNL